MIDFEKAGSASNRRDLIAFHVNGQEFCLDVVKVREIRGWSPATPLPHAPPFMLGVINLRGMVLPIIDLAARMGFPSLAPTSRHAIMVVEIGAQIVGLLVHAVSEIFSVAVTEIQPTPDLALNEARKLVSGVISDKDRMISVVSLDNIIEAGALAA